MDYRHAYATSQHLWVKPLQCIPDLLREMGVLPQTVLRAARVSSGIFADPSNRLDFARVGWLLSECARATECEHFGLLVGRRAGPETAGIIYELMRFTKTVGSALYALRSHLHLHDRGGVITLTDQPRAQVEIAYAVSRPDTPGVGQIGDAAVAILVLMLRGLCGAPWSPVEIKLAHRMPDEIRPYRKFFRAPIKFDAPRFAAIVPADLLDRRIPSADLRMEAAIEAEIGRAEAAHPLSLALRVKQLVGSMLVGCSPSFPQIASALKMSQRTLRRRLADEGTTVTAILDETKAEFARQLIAETGMSIHEIAQTLHYAKPGAFSRAYVGWTGVAPRAARRAALRESTFHARNAGAA